MARSQFQHDLTFSDRTKKQDHFAYQKINFFSRKTSLLFGTFAVNVLNLIPERGRDGPVLLRLVLLLGRPRVPRRRVLRRLVSHGFPQSSRFRGKLIRICRMSIFRISLFRMSLLKGLYSGCLYYKTRKTEKK